MSTLFIILCAVVIAAALGCGATLFVQRTMARSRAAQIIADAEREGEVLKEKKLLDARQEELHIKAEAEKQAQQRLQKVQAEEGRLKQRQGQLNQQQSENQRTRNELEQTRASLDAQAAVLESRQAELDKVERKAREELEHISGL